MNFEKHSLAFSILAAALLICASVFFTYQSTTKQLNASANNIQALADRVAQLEQNQNGFQENAPPQGPTTGLNVDLAGRPLRGDANAKLTIIEFSDFECPFCERVAPVINQALLEYAGKVNLAYVNVPFHQHSFAMAEAFECATLQGKRWEYHDALFAKRTEFFDVNDEYISNEAAIVLLKNISASLSLDQKKFDACLDSHATKSIVQNDFDIAESLMIDGTPSFVINGNKYSGAMPYDQFKAIIEKELAKT